MKKIITTLMAAVILVSCLAPCSFAAYEDEDFGNEIIEPRYEVIANILISFSISASGRADCSATVILPSGYRADLTVELQQKVGGKWDTIHDWKASGRNFVEVSGPWYVPSGYSYQLKVTTEVYDAYGNLVEDPIEYSHVRDY